MLLMPRSVVLPSLVFHWKALGLGAAKLLKMAKIIKKQATGNLFGASCTDLYVSTIQSVSLALQKGNTAIVSSGAKLCKFGLLKQKQTRNKRSSSAQLLPIVPSANALSDDEQGFAIAHPLDVGSISSAHRFSVTKMLHAF